MKVFPNDNEKWKVRLLIGVLITIIVPLWIAVLSSPFTAVGFFLFTLFVLRLDVSHYYDFRRLHREYPVLQKGKNPFELGWKTQKQIESDWACLIEKQGKAKDEEYELVSIEVKKFSKTRGRMFWRKFLSSLIS